MASGAAGLVAFTGSVAGGRAVQAAAGQAWATNLELGGKDPAYVRADADLGHAVANLVDGVCFAPGQSCCGIQAHLRQAPLYDDFVAGYVELASAYRLDDPGIPRPRWDRWCVRPRPTSPARRWPRRWRKGRAR
ncbi:MAG: aldehyde dehydrogenase family protein [Geminicoccaceae bacterium]